MDPAQAAQARQPGLALLTNAARFLITVIYRRQACFQHVLAEILDVSSPLTWSGVITSGLSRLNDLAPHLTLTTPTRPDKRTHTREPWNPAPPGATNGQPACAHQQQIGCGQISLEI
jgi:hypothetical protein